MGGLSGYTKSTLVFIEKKLGERGRSSNYSKVRKGQAWESPYSTAWEYTKSLSAIASGHAQRSGKRVVKDKDSIKRLKT